MRTGFVSFAIFSSVWSNVDVAQGYAKALEMTGSSKYQVRARVDQSCPIERMQLLQEIKYELTDHA